MNWFLQQVFCYEIFVLDLCRILYVAISRKRYKIAPYAIYQMVPFPITLNEP